MHLQDKGSGCYANETTLKEVQDTISFLLSLSILHRIKKQGSQQLKATLWHFDCQVSGYNREHQSNEWGLLPFALKFPNHSPEIYTQKRCDGVEPN